MRWSLEVGGGVVDEEADTESGTGFESAADLAFTQRFPVFCPSSFLIKSTFKPSITSLPTRGLRHSSDSNSTRTCI